MMRRIAGCSLLALLTTAAAPQSGGFSITTPGPVFNVAPERLGKSQPNAGYAPAPLPNRDAFGPAQIKPNSRNAELSPGFFTRADQYHGEGLSASNSVQSEQERRAKPGAGFNLTMPLQ